MHYIGLCNILFKSYYDLLSQIKSYYVPVFCQPKRIVLFCMKKTLNNRIEVCY